MLSCLSKDGWRSLNCSRRQVALNQVHSCKIRPACMVAAVHKRLVTMDVCEACAICHVALPWGLGTGSVPRG